MEGQISVIQKVIVFAKKRFLHQEMNSLMGEFLQRNLWYEDISKINALDL